MLTILHGTIIAYLRCMRLSTSILLVCLILVLAACEEEATSGQPAADQGSNQQVNPNQPSLPNLESDGANLNCNPSSFSDLIEICKNTDTNAESLRLAYSFFPDGTDFDFVQTRVIVPASFKDRIPAGVDVQLSAPLAGDQSGIIIPFNEQGEQMTLEGIVLPFVPPVTKFQAQFELTITRDGIEDGRDGVLLLSNLGTLEDFYQVLLERRQN